MLAYLMRSHVGCRSAVPEKTILLFSEVSSSLRVVSSTCGRISGFAPLYKVSTTCLQKSPSFCTISMTGNVLDV